METELNDLINKIKQEGIEEAKKAADKIVAQAQEKANLIHKEAFQKRDEIIKEAQAQAVSFRHSAEGAVKQAARDVLLNLRSRVTELFGRVVKEQVAKEISPSVLKELIIKAVENFRRDSALDIEVLVNENQRFELEQALFAALNKEAKDKIKLKGSDTVQKGFRIGSAGKDSYLDFTDEAITEAFLKYLNPKLAEFLDIKIDGK